LFDGGGAAFEKTNTRKCFIRPLAKDSGGSYGAACQCLLESGRGAQGTVPISCANYCVLSTTYDTGDGYNCGIRVHGTLAAREVALHKHMRGYVYGPPEYGEVLINAGNQISALKCRSARNFLVADVHMSTSLSLSLSVCVCVCVILNVFIYSKFYFITSIYQAIVKRSRQSQLPS